MEYKKPSDYKIRKNYNQYVLSNATKIEWAFFFTANGNNLELEWQKKIPYRTPNGGINNICCDFYYENKTSDIKIVIECDDISHKTRTIEDAIRDETLRKKGIKVFRFSTKEITWNALECINEVKYFIKEKENLLRKESHEKQLKIEDFKLSIKEIPETSKKENLNYFQYIPRIYDIT